MNRPGLLRTRAVSMTPAASGLLALALVALVGCASAADLDTTVRDDAGVIVEGGDVGVSQLRVGDCVQLPELDGPESIDEVGTFPALPCDDPHTGEVILVEDRFFADLDEFPGQRPAFDSGDQRCTTAIDDYTNTDYDTSQFGFFTVTPTQSTWDDLDDRGLICIGFTFDENFIAPIETTGSIRAG